MATGEVTKGQTVMYKSLHRKLKFEQCEQKFSKSPAWILFAYVQKYLKRVHTKKPITNCSNTNKRSEKCIEKGG